MKDGQTTTDKEYIHRHTATVLLCERATEQNFIEILNSCISKTVAYRMTGAARSSLSVLPVFRRGQVRGDLPDRAWPCRPHRLTLRLSPDAVGQSHYSCFAVDGPQ